MTICLAILSLAQASVASIAVEPISTSLVTGIQVFAPITDLSPRERAALRLGMTVFGTRTEDFTARQILQLTSGRPVLARAGEDHVRIGFVLNPGSEKAAVSLLASLLQRPGLSRADIDRVRLERIAGGIDDWAIGLSEPMPNWADFSEAEIRNAVRKALRPDRLRITLYGAVSAEGVNEDWERRSRDWPRMEPVPRPRFSFGTVTPQTGRARVMQLRSDPFPPGVADFATRYAALIALGVGKGSTLHRVWRDRYAWSYRQEALLLSSATGFRAVLVAAGSAPPEEARKAALEDISAWTEGDLARAVGIASGILENGIDLNPLYPSPDAPMRDTDADRIFLKQYWPAKTGVPWNPTRLLSQIRQIRLEDLRAAATALVDSMKPQVLAPS
jgi:hypothetical protein